MTEKTVAYVITPLDPEKHDRAAFSCGVEQVDNFFRKTANKLSKADNLRVWVMSEPDGAVMGFYAVNAHSVSYQDLPVAFARTRPGHGEIPAAFIAMIGRDVRYAGGGYGADLLVDCLQRIGRASEALGIAVAMLDVLDCGTPERTARRKALYLEYGFQPLPTNPMRLFLPTATIRRAI
jgi:ribosomal protein S18 acetylase RimI-like enzyme